VRPTARQLRRQRADGNPHGLVPAQPLAPFVRELVARCGSTYRAWRYCGVSEPTLESLARRERPHVQRRTAEAILRALATKRKADRYDGLHPAYMAQLRARARVDERVERGGW